MPRIKTEKRDGNSGSFSIRPLGDDAEQLKEQLAQSRRNEEKLRAELIKEEAKLVSYQTTIDDLQTRLLAEQNNVAKLKEELQKHLKEEKSDKKLEEKVKKRLSDSGLKDIPQVDDPTRLNKLPFPVGKNTKPDVGPLKTEKEIKQHRNRRSYRHQVIAKNFLFLAALLATSAITYSLLNFTVQSPRGEVYLGTICDAPSGVPGTGGGPMKCVKWR